MPGIGKRNGRPVESRDADWAWADGGIIDVAKKLIDTQMHKKRRKIFIGLSDQILVKNESP
jgi:hypothetical protein